MFSRVAPILMLALLLLAVPAVSAFGADSTADRTVAAGVVDASPLGSGGELPSWMPRTRGELVPLGLGVLLLACGYAALRRSTGVAHVEPRS